MAADGEMAGSSARGSRRGRGTGCQETEEGVLDQKGRGIPHRSASAASDYLWK